MKQPVPHRQPARRATEAAAPALRSAQAAHILGVATELFAAHGFDGMTTRQLAKACGLNIATVHHHVGTKGEIYRAVIQQLYAEERAVVEGFLVRAEQATTDGRELAALLAELAGALIDMLDAHPARAQLYLRRWLEEPRGAGTEDAPQLLALYGALDALLSRAQRAGQVRRDLDRAMFLRSFDWLVYGYFVAGPLDWEAWRGDPHAPRHLVEFKRYLETYLGRMLGLDDPAPGPRARR